MAHHVLAVTAAEFVSAFEVLAGMTEEPVLDLDLAVVYAALTNYDPRIAGDTFISGMGSDQWFGDMALEDCPGGFPVRLDWTIVDQNAHQQVAQVHGCKFVFPFLSGPMLALSQQIPADMKKDKKLLRTLAVANTIPHRGARTEIQIPEIMRQILVKVYGHRAWPRPVSDNKEECGSVQDQVLRQIVLGLWLEKQKSR